MVGLSLIAKLLINFIESSERWSWLYGSWITTTYAISAYHP
jgi:hypothetical protein